MLTSEWSSGSSGHADLVFDIRPCLSAPPSQAVGLWAPSGGGGGCTDCCRLFLSHSSYFVALRTTLRNRQGSWLTDGCRCLIAAAVTEQWLLFERRRLAVLLSVLERTRGGGGGGLSYDRRILPQRSPVAG